MRAVAGAVLTSTMRQPRRGLFCFAAVCFASVACGGDESSQGGASSGGGGRLSGTRYCNGIVDGDLVPDPNYKCKSLKVDVSEEM